MKSSRFVVVLLAALSLASSLFGQAVFGNIAGTVRDPTGAAQGNASITITDLDRGSAYRTQSSSDGNYSQTHLLAGHYQVKVEAAGFGTYTANADVQVDATTRLDATLSPASVQTNVEVTDVTPLLTTDRPEISTTLTGQQVNQLPALNRNVTNLLLLVPGVEMSNEQMATSENPQQGIQVTANGQFSTNNGFVLDGTENESAILGIAVINPNIDSLQQFKVSTSNYDAEFGAASGALIQATTKSGTNQWHGSLFEYLQNNLTNATNPFTQINPPLHWNQFGGSVGFPILKDKLFGFFDYQGTRQHNGGTILTTVPTQAERNGDLRALLGNYICADGSNSATPCGNPVMVQTTEGTSVPAQAGMVFNPNTGDPTTGAGRQAYSQNGQVNVITPSAAMVKLLNNVPLPNAGTGIVNNYASSQVQRFNTDQYDGRVDYILSATTHVFGRYTIADYDNYSPAAFGDAGGGPSAFNFSGDSIDRNQSLALGFDHTFGPNLLTDARFGFYRYRIRVQPNDAGATPATDAGIPGLNTGSADTTGMPAIYINGNGGLNFGYGLGVNQCNCPLKETENQFQWVNNWTTIAGDHTVKFGVDIRRAQQQRIPSDQHRSGEINFSDSITGNPEVDTVGAGLSTGSALAAYLLGLPSTFDRFYTGSDYYPGLRQTRIFLFVQDSWRINSRLTFNYGLRWEDYLPQTAAKPGGAGSFDPSTGDILAAGIGSVPRNLGVKGYNLGFAPRIGIAYQAEAKTVIRTGYGRSFNPSGLGAVFGQGADYNPPILNSQSINQSNNYAPVFNLLDGPPTPVNPPVSASGRYPLPNGVGINYFLWPLNSYRIPLADFWNFTVQRQLAADYSLQVAYVGNFGRHLYETLNANQAVPGPGSLVDRRPFYNLYGLEQGIYQYCNCGNSNYNALQVTFQKQYSKSLDFLLTYTWSKALDTTEGGNLPSNSYDVRSDYGPASFNRQHLVTFTFDWDLPFGLNRHWKLGGSKVADLFAGGWRLTGVNTFGSGLPFTPLVNNAPLLNDSDFARVRADLVGDPNVSNQSASLWFNPAAYTEPQQPYRNGTAGRDSLIGPKLYQSNVSLAKNLLWSEKRSLELRADAFNVFNHVNLGIPNATIDQEGAGQITYIQVPMRQMQFGLHFHF